MVPDLEIWQKILLECEVNVGARVSEIWWKR